MSDASSDSAYARGDRTGGEHRRRESIDLEIAERELRDGEERGDQQHHHPAGGESQAEHIYRTTETRAPRNLGDRSPAPIGAYVGDREHRDADDSGHERRERAPRQRSVGQPDQASCEDDQAAGQTDEAAETRGDDRAGLGIGSDSSGRAHAPIIAA
ncbi:hypothetical protein ACIPV2_08230 [Microbacterium sp. NPDC089987]|uniref:hypothetical protein n=1 Tax=Microbacterium sp. NPDC089987 TaxID=3364202 RepID=UPI003822025B